MKVMRMTGAAALVVGLFIGGRCVVAETLHWTSNGPPAGVDAVAFAPSDSRIIYAGSTGIDGGKGVFKSSDGGQTWTAVNKGITNKRINAVAVDPRDPRI